MWFPWYPLRKPVYNLTVFTPPALSKRNHSKDYENLLFSNLEVISTASAGLKTQLLLTGALILSHSMVALPSDLFRGAASNLSCRSDLSKETQVVMEIIVVFYKALVRSPLLLNAAYPVKASHWRHCNGVIISPFEVKGTWMLSSCKLSNQFHHIHNRRWAYMYFNPRNTSECKWMAVIFLNTWRDNFLVILSL